MAATNDLAVALTAGTVGAAVAAVIPAITAVVKTWNERRQARHGASGVEAVITAEEHLKAALRGIRAADQLEPAQRERVLSALREVSHEVSKDIDQLGQPSATAVAEESEESGRAAT